MCARSRRPVEQIDALWGTVDHSLAPTNAECVQMAREIASKLGRTQAVTLIGTTQQKFRVLVSGQQGPSAGLRRAVWYTHCLIFAPEKMDTLFDVATWGRFKRSVKPMLTPQDGSDYQI